jgi:hypothetical protein
MTVKKSKAIFLIGIMSILLFAGCGRDWKAEIESNTSWHGAYGGITGSQWVTSEVQGQGSKTIDLPDDDRVCCSFQQTGNGYVRVTIKDEGGGPFRIFAESSRSGQTNINGGTVNICSEGTIQDYFNE